MSPVCDIEKQKLMVKQKHGGIAAEQNELPRTLGLWDSTFLIIGCVIGSGIFLVPSDIAKAVSTPLLIISVWVVSGLLAFLGALTYAELGAAIPKAGGPYVVLKEAYGRPVGFLFGWVTFLVIQTGSVAAVAVAFAKYLGYFFPLDSFVLMPAIPIGSGIFAFKMQITGIELSAIGGILLLSGINAVSVSFGAKVQNLFTILKSLAILGLVAAGFMLGSPHGGASLSSNHVLGLPLLSAFGIAMVAALWAYDGWNNISFIAGEVKEPHTTIPKSLFLGTASVIAIYVVTNLAYLYILSPEAMAQSTLVAADVAKSFMGNMGGGLISAAILVSTFGCVNGMILSGPRVYFAMARDGLFFSKVGEVHPKFLTPALSICLQAIWASLLTLSGSYDQLFTYVMFTAWVFYGMTGASIFIFRKKAPDMPRPYKTWGYPIVPLIFVLVSGFLVINTLIAKPLESLAGLGILLAGIPVYLFWQRKKDIKP